MVDLIKLAEELSELCNHNKVLFLKTEPEIANFTIPFNGSLTVYGEKNRVTVQFPAKEVENVYHQLRYTVFGQGMTTVFWNVKNLISFFKFHCPKTQEIESKVIDLKLVEAFLGIKKNAPVSLNEALCRLGPYINNEDAKKIHNKIHKPLALHVIPDMETYRGVIDDSISKYVYPSYEIEGQTFGRLNCRRSFTNCITPHNMGDDRKKTLRLKGENDFFIHFDFRHMEVSMLQWLSQDDLLKQVMDYGEDLYKGIYKSVFGESCDTEAKREIIKSLFLPIMFGQTPQGLEKEYGISYQVASQVHRMIKEKFKKAWQYMEDHHEQAKTYPEVKDYLGRVRSFADNPLSVRGFLVQSASSVFCQEKLIELHASLCDYGKMLYSIHDGYILFANRENLNKVIVNGLKALQSESKMFQGLFLKSTCSIGANLTRMKPIL